MKTRNIGVSMPSFGNADSYAKEAKARVKGFVGTKGASVCKTPGMKIRSKGRGRGLARGKGYGPMGVPYRLK
jgi:hypothetical protein